MEVEQLEEALRVINILALCTGLRPLVMVDYGGKMPKLQEHLCSVVKLSQKESAILEPLRVMVIDDMIYIFIMLREFIYSEIHTIMDALKPIRLDLTCTSFVFFCKGHIADVVYNLTTKSLHLFKILISRFQDYEALS
ncbi:hypothetical protein Sjap_017418 [Stephania japonica]|uniref:Uncharacterized protein n=1 Tax=Stephania japonica TaxID=461633 RepID=A0AAP0NJE6_9MAGN